MQEWLVIILSVLVLAQYISSIFIHSPETVWITRDKQVALVPTGERLVAQKSKSIIAFTPKPSSFDVEWYLLGWHKIGTYPISDKPIKVLGFTVEKHTSPGGDGIRVTKPNNIFYAFR